MKCVYWGPETKYIDDYAFHRYLGDEGDDGSSNESRAKALLAKLQRKAKVKEQQSLSCQEEYQSKTTVENDGDTSVKKKRKNKGGNLDETKHPKKRKVSPPDLEELSEGDNARKKKDTKKMQLTEEDKGVYLLFYITHLQLKWYNIHKNLFYISISYSLCFSP